VSTGITLQKQGDGLGNTKQLYTVESAYKPLHTSRQYTYSVCTGTTIMLSVISRQLSVLRVTRRGCNGDEEELFFDLFASKSGANRLRTLPVTIFVSSSAVAGGAGAVIAEEAPRFGSVPFVAVPRKPGTPGAHAGGRGAAGACCEAEAGRWEARVL
jgi:hypothetical protein